LQIINYACEKYFIYYIDNSFGEHYTENPRP